MFFYGPLVFLFVLDRLTKFWALESLQNPFEITSWFRLVYAENFGIAFSFPVPLWLIIVASFLILFFFVKELLHQKNWAYGLIVVGAVGNLIDRFWYGYVIDWVSFWDFPIFNLADACISLGIVLFGIASLRKKN